MTNRLHEVFDISQIPVVEVIGLDDITTIIPPSAEGTEEDVDFNFVRANHYLLAKQASDAMVIAMKIARESEQPRSIETLSVLLKTASEVSRQLLLLSKDKAETKQKKMEVKKPTPTTTIENQNIVFAGSSSELNMLLKGEPR